MRLYIDKENLISLISSKAQDSFEDCARAVRRELDVQYNFSKEEIKSNDALQFWFNRFGQGVKGTQDFVPEKKPEVFPPRPLKTNFYNDKNPETLKAIYLLNDNHICDLVKQKSCVLIGKLGEETKVLSSLLIEGSETQAKKILSWKEYCPALPLTDIIICDNHYFKHATTYAKNDNELIRSLVKIPQSSPVNVVIFTKSGEIDSKIDIKKEQINIKEIVKKATNSNKSSVTIVTSYSTHDRCLITNYYRIKHGSCFHLNDNGLKEDVTTEIKSHINRSNEEQSKHLIDVFQKVLNRSPICIGDKKSNFLTFQ